MGINSDAFFGDSIFNYAKSRIANADSLAPRTSPLYVTLSLFKSKKWLFSSTSVSPVNCTKLSLDISLLLYFIIFIIYKQNMNKDKTKTGFAVLKKMGPGESFLTKPRNNNMLGVVFSSHDLIVLNPNPELLIRHYERQHDLSNDGNRERYLGMLTTLHSIKKHLSINKNDRDVNFAVAYASLPKESNMLDFSLTLTKQSSAVRKSLESLGFDVDGDHHSMTGAELYSSLIDSPYFPEVSITTNSEHKKDEMLAEAWKDYSASDTRDETKVPTSRYVSLVKSGKRFNVRYFPSVANKNDSKLEGDYGICNALAKNGIEGIVKGVGKDKEFVVFDVSNIRVNRLITQPSRKSANNA